MATTIPVTSAMTASRSSPMGYVLHTVAGPAMLTSLQLPLKLLAPNYMVGSIIGRGGATIKETTQRTGAKVHISQNDELHLPDRMVTITASTTEVILSAQHAIYSKIQEEGAPTLRLSPLPVC